MVKFIGISESHSVNLDYISEVKVQSREPLEVVATIQGTPTYFVGKDAKNLFHIINEFLLYPYTNAGYGPKFVGISSSHVVNLNYVIEVEVNTLDPLSVIANIQGNPTQFEGQEAANLVDCINDFLVNPYPAFGYGAKLVPRSVEL